MTGRGSRSANPCSDLPGFWPAVSREARVFARKSRVRLSDQHHLAAIGTLDALHGDEFSKKGAKPEHGSGATPRTVPPSLSGGRHG